LPNWVSLNLLQELREIWIILLNSPVESELFELRSSWLFLNLINFISSYTWVNYVDFCIFRSDTPYLLPNSIYACQSQLLQDRIGLKACCIWIWGCCLLFNNPARQQALYDLRHARSELAPPERLSPFFNAQRAIRSDQR
jgi:hypothetical protein